MPKKQLAVGVPAALNLRAELARAQGESRGGGGGARRGPAERAKALDTPNRGVDARAQSDALALDLERTSRTQANARRAQALEEKARIYDMLSGLRQEESGAAPRVRLDEAHLARILDESSVDFVRKRQERAAATESGDEGSASDDSMVEIVDEFGRSRTVPRSKVGEYCGDPRSSSSSDSSDDGRAAAAESSRRNHGTSYYHLSSNYAQREEQLAVLHRLHRETTAGRQAAATSAAEIQAQQLAHRRSLVCASLRRSAAAAAAAARPPAAPGGA